MASPPGRSPDRELDKICQEQFEDFRKKYGDKSTWEKLDPSKAYIPSFYLRHRVPQRRFRSEEAHELNAVRCLRFTNQRPYLQSKESSLIKDSKKTTPTVIHVPNTSTSRNERLNFRVKRFPPSLTVVTEKMEASNSSSQERKSEKENLAVKSPPFSKDRLVESGDLTSDKNRRPFDEKSPVS